MLAADGAGNFALYATIELRDLGAPRTSVAVSEGPATWRPQHRVRGATNSIATASACASQGPQRRPSQIFPQDFTLQLSCNRCR